MEPERGEEQWPPDMPKVPMHRVQSSAIEAVGYDPVNWFLHVRFRHTGLYTYRGVPPDVLLAFLRADSKGRFYNRYIRGTYSYERRRRTGGERPEQPGSNR